MEIRDRLTQILSFKQLSSSAFADTLEIQRSNMSHYLSGRNKPGVEILQRILDKFPEINADWLIMGRGEMTTMVESDLFNDYKGLQTNPSASSSSPPMLKKIVQNRKIDRITVYFDDGTYQEFYSDCKK